MHCTHYCGWFNLIDMWDTIHPKGFGQNYVWSEGLVTQLSDWNGLAPSHRQQTSNIFWFLTILAHLKNVIPLLDWLVIRLLYDVVQALSRHPEICWFLNIMSKVQESDMSGNLYLFETNGTYGNDTFSIYKCPQKDMGWPCISLSLACFPSAGLASELLAKAPDVGRVLVCDGPHTQGVFRNYMLVSKSVLLRALLLGYLERCSFAEASHTAVSRSPFKHSCCGFSVRFQTLRPCCSLSPQFLKLSPQQRACKKKPLCGAAPQRARKKHYKFQEPARLQAQDHIVKFWKCVNKWWQSGPELWVEHWDYCAGVCWRD